MATDEILRALLMYFVLPVWLAAGFADYLCHRAAHIEHNSGWKESLLHLVEFAEMAVPILAALFFEITSGVIFLMIVCLVLHQATAMWDVSYAATMREVRPVEQHVHSVLEMMPLTGLLIVIRAALGCLHRAVRPRACEFRVGLKKRAVAVDVHRHCVVADLIVRGAA